jgi:DNA-3-methyladenine glycosylase II
MSTSAGPLDGAKAVGANDCIMDSLRARFGYVRLREREPFAVLGRSIVAQQISTKAANTIRARIAQQLGGWSADGIAKSAVETLRSLGLTEAKAVCLRQVAELAILGDLARLQKLADDEIKTRLTSIRGIGAWTADMFLIFCLAREDVWPISDAGLRSAGRQLYGVQTRLSLLELGDRFRPFRSLAAIYLWKSLENDVG